MDEKIVAVLKQHSYSVPRIRGKIEELFDLVGINEGLKDRKILIKPNCTGSFSPKEGRTTHPAVMEALILHLLSLNSEIAIGESSTVGTDTFSAYEKTGIFKVAQKLNVRIVDFKKSNYIELENGSGIVQKKISFPEEALSADCLISLAKLKTNYVTTISCAMKNLKGLLKDGDKKNSHHVGLSESVADICNALKRKIKVIALVDGILGSELYEPKKRGLLIASNDLAACDIVCARAMGIDPGDIKFLNLAKDPKAGNINVLGDGLGDPAVFSTCDPGLDHMAEKFKIKIIDGNPCTSCTGSLYHILNKLAKTGAEYPDDLEIVAGCCKNRRIAKNAILFGKCAAEADGIFKVKGCPPVTSDFMKVLKRRFGKK
ncbi:MAG: DUF362 domain-containing protein [Candidatus Paceibacterota bacterium]|jgi:uncharacterized protein (DUF362 family)